MGKKILARIKEKIAKENQCQDKQDQNNQRYDDQGDFHDDWRWNDH